MGLGDVYLGAPVATPVDPRHRLVTTKYNPARTWTPENAVGIGGAYLCVYGMEGPGGYQFVGRTVQMWNRYRQTADFKDGKPWLLRFFDQIRFYPVSESELLKLRQDFITGHFKLRVEETTFSLKQYNAFLQQNAASISAFKARQQAAFEAERERWKAEGKAEYVSETTLEEADTQSELDLPDGRARRQRACDRHSMETAGQRRGSRQSREAGAGRRIHENGIRSGCAGQRHGRAVILQGRRARVRRADAARDSGENDAWTNSSRWGLGDIPSLLRRYASGELTPSQVVEAVHASDHNDPDHVWIYKLPLEALSSYAREVEARASDMAALPLYGIPFAIKDNIDLAGVPTTAACPAFAYTPQHRLRPWCRD